jgi:hypothetical protein
MGRLVIAQKVESRARSISLSLDLWDKSPEFVYFVIGQRINGCTALLRLRRRPGASLNHMQALASALRGVYDDIVALLL